MGLTNLNKNRPILITGKPGYGKSKKAKEFCEEPLVFYANEIDTTDIGSFGIEGGIIIEDVHHKPRKEDILYLIRHYKGQIVLTSINEKSVPSEIKSKCQIKRAGRTNFMRNEILEIAPRSEEPKNTELDTFSLVMEVLKNPNRDDVANMLLFNRPPDTQLITWLSENVHPNRLLFIDGVVKRRWPAKYFYEMIAYSIPGNFFGRLNMPKRYTYSKVTPICRKLKVKDEQLLRQLLKDPDFKSWAKTKLNHSECRILGIGEKRRRKKTDPVVYDSGSLEQFM